MRHEAGDTRRRRAQVGQAQASSDDVSRKDASDRVGAPLSVFIETIYFCDTFGRTCRVILRLLIGENGDTLMSAFVAEKRPYATDRSRELARTVSIKRGAFFWPVSERLINPELSNKPWSIRTGRFLASGQFFPEIFLLG